MKKSMILGWVSGCAVLNAVAGVSFGLSLQLAPPVCVGAPCVSVAVPGVAVSVGVPVYAAPPVYVAPPPPPPPVVVAPPVYMPAPVYAPAPVVIAAPIWGRPGPPVVWGPPRYYHPRPVRGHGYGHGPGCR